MLHNRMSTQSATDHGYQSGERGGIGGVLLLCEVDANGTWLLFSPIRRSQVFAWRGLAQNEISVMIEGGSVRNQWRQTLLLRCSDQGTQLDWIRLLADTPVTE